MSQYGLFCNITYSTDAVLKIFLTLQDLWVYLKLQNKNHYQFNLLSQVT